MLTHSRLYSGVTYPTESLLMINIYLFLAEELNASQHAFTDDFGDWHQATHREMLMHRSDAVTH